MKTLIYAVVAASVIGAPAMSFAQTTSPLTRAQVREELIQLEQAGYRVPVGNDPYYPDNIQAAQARVAAKNAEAQSGMSGMSGMSGYGAAMQGTSESGAPASMENTKSIFFGR